MIVWIIEVGILWSCLKELSSMVTYFLVYLKKE